MSAPGPAPLDVAERSAQDAVRALPVPAATAAFRARLKHEFATGAIERPRSLATAPARVLVGPWAARPRAFAMAAAAAAMIAALVFVANRGPAWQVAAVTGDGIAVIDQRGIPLGHADDLAAALHPGARIELPADASLELMAPGDLAIEITPGTRMILPPTPGRWFRRAIRTELGTGELRITTGPRFHGARLAIATPEVHVEVVGTTLAVIREPQGTCVCVLEGRVRVGAMTGPRPGPMVPVDGGRRRYVFNDGRPPEMATMRDTEHLPLGALRRQFRAHVGP